MEPRKTTRVPPNRRVESRIKRETPANKPGIPSVSRRIHGAALFLATFLAGASSALGDEPRVAPHPPLRGSPTIGRGGLTAESLLGIGATAALAVLGFVTMLRARLRPSGKAGLLQVVGRAQLGRHAVYLLRAGDRTLIVGVGNQGPPALLGELDSSAESDRCGLGSGTPTRGED